jgi:hypothetical protein
MILVLPTTSHVKCVSKLVRGGAAGAGGLKDLVVNRHVSEPEKSEHRNFHPMMIGDLHRLVSENKLDAIQALIKSTNLEEIRPEFFYRDKLHQTPLSLAWKRKDKAMISSLLSLGKFQERPV